MINRVLIGIAGGSGSGKTTIAKAIAAKLNPVAAVIIQQDSYYKDRSHIPEKQRESINYDHPCASDIELLIDHLKKLKNNLNIEKPYYDFTTHTRKKKTVTIYPVKVIILEGILVLENKDLRNLMDIKIFVETAPDMRFIRRLQRDIKERRRSLESVINQYLETVRPMHLEFVEGSRRYADKIIPGSEYNQPAIDMVATQIKLMLKEEFINIT